MKRFLSIVLTVVILVPLIIIGVQIVREPGSGQASAPVDNLPAQIASGEYLARVGNCMACHTVRGGPAYAGGRAIATPFGNIYSSNITPDPETGIGRWTADDFWRALHNGKSKDGSFLYPAFPYTNYTRVTRTDADAIYAYFRTLAAVRQANREHELRFPYNQRILLAFWRTLYFTPGEYRPQASQSAEWNRGAYLVQGLGHCSACHTSRNALGGESVRRDLAGGMLPMNWYASSLTSDPVTGLGDWEAQEIAGFLQTGVSRRGAAFGPMAEVVAGSLQHLADTDIHAITSYLKSMPPTQTVQRKERRISDADQAVLQRGARLYEKHCAECHRADGKGMPPAYPPLVGNHSLTVPSTINPIRIVLNGGFPPATKGNPRPYGMPPFGATLTDSEVAAVVSYIRTGWGNGGSPVSPLDVGQFRSAPVE